MAAEGGEDLLFEVAGSTEVFRSFEDMGLKEDLLKGVYAYGACGGGEREGRGGEECGWARGKGAEKARAAFEVV
jgi:hypothetical protein